MDRASRTKLQRSRKQTIKGKFKIAIGCLLTQLLCLIRQEVLCRSKMKTGMVSDEDIIG